jgi:hypothetical protein
MESIFESLQQFCLIVHPLSTLESYSVGVQIELWSTAGSFAVGLISQSKFYVQSK